MKKILAYVGVLAALLAASGLHAVIESYLHPGWKVEMLRLMERVSQLELKVEDLEKETEQQEDRIRTLEADVETARDEVREEVQAEMEEIRENNQWMEDMITEFAHRIENCETEIEEHHPSETEETSEPPAETTPRFSSWEEMYEYYLG